jgi:hypothetical protein
MSLIEPVLPLNDLAIAKSKKEFLKMIYKTKFKNFRIKKLQF